jgi:hypothetical protein
MMWMDATLIQVAVCVVVTLFAVGFAFGEAWALSARNGRRS